MSDATPHLGLPLIAAAQAQKHVTHNEALGLLDALVQLACLDKDLSAPPASPAEGDRYLVAAANPTGAWSGLSGQVVRLQDGVWTGAVPQPGWFAYVIDEADLYIFDGSAWTSFRRAITAIQLTGRLGINTTADATNRLAVKSDAALLSWDDATPGSGHMRVAVNKQAGARDAALVFQTGYAARALLGTLGTDDFCLKVSGDGVGFSTALTASAATGGIDFASTDAALAAAATTDLGGAGARRVVVTGSAVIASFGTGANRERFLRFSGASTLTHDPAKLVLPTKANILTAADDTCIATSDASGNWRVRHYQRADGTALAASGGVASVAGRTGAVTLAVADVAGAAPLASPALIGTPTAPTASGGAATTQVATTAFVANAVSASGGSAAAAVLYTAQSLSPAQQRQVLANVGASGAAVRQSVLNGPMASGAPSFLPASTAGTLTLTTQGLGTTPLVVSCASGFDAGGAVDIVAVLAANQSVTLPASASLFLYLAYGSGAPTLGAGTLAPAYQFGGAASTANGQFTFDVQAMQGWLGNGSTAVKANRVYVGEAVTSASGVTGTVAYAYAGSFDSGWIGTPPAAATPQTIVHNLGLPPMGRRLILEAVAGDIGYAVGDQLATDAGLYTWASSTLLAPVSLPTTRNATTIMPGAYVAFGALNRASGAPDQITRVNWKQRLAVTRGW